MFLATTTTRSSFTTDNKRCNKECWKPAS